MAAGSAASVGSHLGLITYLDETNLLICSVTYKSPSVHELKASGQHDRALLRLFLHLLPHHAIMLRRMLGEGNDARRHSNLFLPFDRATKARLELLMASNHLLLKNEIVR